MSVRIELDNPGAVYTCLNLLTGRVVFNVEKNSQETISSITVKMEGISRTRLWVPENDTESRSKAELEIHKLLYKVQTVFPAPAIIEQQLKSMSASHAGYTLPAGTYTYPFKIQIPVNNHCQKSSSLLSKINVDGSKGINIDYAKEPKYHTVNTLPPSLFSLPGGTQGEGGYIRYFVKVTVNRPAFYRKNLRKDQAFVFLPFEPPRPPATGGETYARRQHLFTLPLLTSVIVPKKKPLLGVFSTTRVEQQFVPAIPEVDPRFTVEARLPSPPILVPKEPLGLRIIVVKLEPFTRPMVLRQLQIRLLIITYLTAHEQKKKLTLTMPLFDTHSRYENGMNIPYTFGDENTPVGVEIEADRSIWQNWTLPESISPSFRTCNITREYQLEITCGMSLGMDGNIDYIPLTMPIEVFSGIKAPKWLVERARIPQSWKHLTRNSRTFPPPSPSLPNPPRPPRPASSSNMSSSTSFLAPVHSRSGLTGEASSPTSPVSLHQNKSEVSLSVHEQFPVDAPPTYEDAMLLGGDVDVAVAGGPTSVARQYPMQEGYFSGISELDIVRDEKRAYGGDAGFV